MSQSYKIEKEDFKQIYLSAQQAFALLEVLEKYCKNYLQIVEEESITHVVGCAREKAENTYCKLIDIKDRTNTFKDTN